MAVLEPADAGDLAEGGRRPLTVRDEWSGRATQPGGTRDGAQQTETFHEKVNARTFEQDLEEPRHDWPEAWVKGVGYVPVPTSRPRRQGPPAPRVAASTWTSSPASARIRKRVDAREAAGTPSKLIRNHHGLAPRRQRAGRPGSLSLFDDEDGTETITC